MDIPVSGAISPFTQPLSLFSSQTSKTGVELSHSGHSPCDQFFKFVYRYTDILIDPECVNFGTSSRRPTRYAESINILEVIHDETLGTHFDQEEDLPSIENRLLTPRELAFP